MFKNVTSIFNNFSRMNKVMFVVFIAFIVWMVYFDENSYFIHQELDDEIIDLQESTTYYKKEIEEDQKMIKDLNNPKLLEKFARETYRMKKQNEDIFIVEFDTIIKE